MGKQKQGAEALESTSFSILGPLLILSLEKGISEVKAPPDGGQTLSTKSESSLPGGRKSLGSYKICNSNNNKRFHVYSKIYTISLKPCIHSTW